MPKTIQALLPQYLAEIQNIYGSHLKSVILYGSYARGDYTEDSDIDIMILVDLPNEEMDSYLDSLSEIGFQYNVEHDIWIMPIVKNLEHFQHWVSAYPFYKNIQKEGVILYETVTLDRNQNSPGLTPAMEKAFRLAAKSVMRKREYPSIYNKRRHNMNIEVIQSLYRTAK